MSATTPSATPHSTVYTDAQLKAIMASVPTASHMIHQAFVFDLISMILPHVSVLRTESLSPAGTGEVTRRTIAAAKAMLMPYVRSKSLQEPPSESFLTSLIALIIPYADTIDAELSTARATKQTALNSSRFQTLIKTTAAGALMLHTLYPPIKAEAITDAQRLASARETFLAHWAAKAPPANSFGWAFVANVCISYALLLSSIVAYSTTYNDYSFLKFSALPLAITLSLILACISILNFYKKSHTPNEPINFSQYDGIDSDQLIKRTVHNAQKRGVLITPNDHAVITTYGFALAVLSATPAALPVTASTLQVDSAPAATSTPAEVAPSTTAASQAPATAHRFAEWRRQSAALGADFYSVYTDRFGSPVMDNQTASDIETIVLEHGDTSPDLFVYPHHSARHYFVVPDVNKLMTMQPAICIASTRAGAKECAVVIVTKHVDDPPSFVTSKTPFPIAGHNGILGPVTHNGICKAANTDANGIRRNLQAMRTNVVFLSAICTGSNPSKDRVIELGVASENGENLLSLRFNPQAPIRPSSAHSITDEDVEQLPLFETGIDELFTVLKNKNVVIHDVDTITGIINAELAISETVIQEICQPVCSLKHARRRYPSLLPALNVLAAKFNIIAPSSMSALDQAQLLRQTYFTMLDA